MAVDPELVRRDLYLPAVGEHDRRVVHDGWTYYVQAVRRPRTLGRPAPAVGGVGELVLVLPVVWCLGLLARRRPWTVGVVRLGDVATWNDPKPVVVHRETTVDPDPTATIDRLVAEIETGRFAPSPDAG